MDLLTPEEGEVVYPDGKYQVIREFEGVCIDHATLCFEDDAMGIYLDVVRLRLSHS